jgi:hypothetical protein
MEQWQALPIYSEMNNQSPTSPCGDCLSETDLYSLLFRVEYLKDPLIGNLVCACQISDAFATGVAGPDLFVAFQFGEVLRENRLGGTGNAVIEEVKHTLDSGIHGGYTGDVEAR